MAIRVRKLAKELERSAGEVLGLLHHLGFSRYTKPDDMVNDAVAAKARRAARQGVRAPVVPVRDTGSRSARPPSTQQAPSDLMSQLVPGVQRQGSPAPAVAPAAKPLPAPAPPVPVPEVVPPPAEPTADSEELIAARARLAALQEQLAAQTAEIEALKGVVEEAPAGMSLGELLRDRGLRGPDESDRALESLARARQLASVLGEARLSPTAAVALRRSLAGMLLLDGTPPAELSGAAVAVSPDRADAPGAETLGRLCSKLGEQLLLSGFKRMLCVGLGPRWHEAVRVRLDRRVEIAFRPGGPRDASRVAADAEGVDLVLYVGVEVSEVPQGLSATVVRGEADLARALEAAVHQLATAP